MSENNLPLEGKAALVTGASRGLGRALAIELAQRGANLILASRDENDLAQTAQIANSKRRVEILIQACDVGSLEQVEALAAESQQAFGGLDILINNAGLGRAALVADSNPEDAELMIRVNLWGLYLVTRACLPLMKDRKGWVVNISSVAAINPSPGFAVYAATKAAVSSFSQSLRQELRHDGVRVMNVSPGMMETDFFKGFTKDGKAPVPTDAGPLLQSTEAARAIVDTLCLPTNAAVNELTIRPVWQER
jgi:3-oxoacyl-[acyl-carrier protein] reductase